MDVDEDAAIAEDVLKLELHTAPLNLNWNQNEEEEESDAEEYSLEQVTIKDVNYMDDEEDVDQPSTSKAVALVEDVHLDTNNSQEDYASGDEELIDLSSDFAPTPINLLKLNFAYQEVIEQQLAVVDRLLQENHYRKSIIKENLDRSSQHDGKRPKLEAALFNQLFFKDDQGLGPANPDLDRIKAEVGPGFASNLLPPSKWKKSTNDALISGIEANSQRFMMEPLLTQLEYLQEKLKHTESAQVREKIAEVQNRIDKLKETPRSELVNDRFHDWDWDGIANLSLEFQQTAVNCELHWKNVLHPSINHSPWTEQEDEKLIELLSKHKNHDWRVITEELGTNRSIMDVVRRYQLKINSSFKSRPWTPEEDAMLMRLVEKYRVGNVIPYTQIALHMKNRYATQIVHRWTKSLDPSYKKTKFTAEEDAALMRAVSIHGQKWSKIRDLGLVPGRNDAQLRERYINTLKGAKKSSWTKEEDAALERWIGELGVGNWAAIAARMKGRLDCQCSRRWLTIQKSRAEGKAVAYRKDTEKKKILFKLRKKLHKAIFSENQGIKREGPFANEMSNMEPGDKSNRADLPVSASSDEVFRAYSTVAALRKSSYVKKRPPRSQKEQELDAELYKLMSRRYEPMSEVARHTGTNSNAALKHITANSTATKKEIFVRFVKALNINAEKTLETMRSKKNSLRRGKTVNGHGVAGKREGANDENMISQSNGQAVNGEKEFALVQPAKTSQPFARNLYLPLCAPNRATVRAYRDLYKDRERRVMSAKKIVSLRDEDDAGKHEAETLLANMRGLYKYKIFRSRFNALFTWPTLLASLVPYARRCVDGSLYPVVRMKRPQPGESDSPIKRAKLV